MKSIIFLLFCLLPVNKMLAQYKSQLNPNASVVFPSKPEEMHQDGQLILVSMMDKENKITGMATTIDVSQYGVDSNAVVSNYNNSLFVDLILQNIAGQFAGAYLVSKKKVAVGKLMGYDVVFKNNNPTKAIPYQNIYAHVMFAGSHIYALSILDIPGVDGIGFTEKFFSSLKVD